VPIEQQAPGPVDALGLLERSVAYARASLQLVTDDRLDAPTPCRHWNVLHLLRHMDDSLAALTDAAARGYVDLAPCRDADRSIDLAARIRTRACTLLGAWTARSPTVDISVGGQLIVPDLLASTGALEIAVHGWDLAAACGQPRPLPPRLAADLWAVGPLLVSDADRPARFGKPIELARSATAGEQLLAFLGRTPRTRCG